MHRKSHRLGSPPQQHAKKLRSAQRQAQKASAKAIENAKAGKCGRAFSFLINASAWDGSLQSEAFGMGGPKAQSKKQSRRSAASYAMVDRAIDAFKAHCKLEPK